MTNTNPYIDLLISDLRNWSTPPEFLNEHQQFTKAQIKRLIWQREQNGLSSCIRIVGKRAYINSKLFALWMAGQLPEQINQEPLL